jgi:arylsulfatase A-like enzyme
MFYKGQYSGPFVDGNIWQESWQTKDTFYGRDFSDGSKPAKFIPIPIKTADVEYLKASYDTGVSYVDDQLRLFFDSVKNNPNYEDTLFIISSEHGEDLKEHGYIFHGDIYNVNTKVPLVFIWPGLKPSHIKETVSSLDIMPTILELLHIPSPALIEGKSLLPLLLGSTSDTQRSVFTERPPFDEYAVQNGQWKYILRNPDKIKTILPTLSDPFFIHLFQSDDTFSDELYNLTDDPYEQHNLIGKGFKEEVELRNEALAFRLKMQQARKTNQIVPQVDSSKLIPYP